MSEAVQVKAVEPPGMILVRARGADLAVGLGAAGLLAPGPRRIEALGAVRVAWMSPDECLVMLPRDELGAMLAALRAGFAGRFHLVEDVSDMRGMIRLEGGAAREVLARATPADVAPGMLEPGELRRSRVAQVSAAFWIEEGGAVVVICFRSVLGYVFELFEMLARDGAGLALWDGAGARAAAH